MRLLAFSTYLVAAYSIGIIFGLSGAQAQQGPRAELSAAQAKELKAYRERISSAIRRKMPRFNEKVARDSAAVIGFSIERSGLMSKAHVVKSSGSPVIDGLALRSIPSGQTFLPFPTGIQGDRLKFTIPMRFK